MSTIQKVYTHRCVGVSQGIQDSCFINVDFNYVSIAQTTYIIIIHCN